MNYIKNQQLLLVVGACTFSSRLLFQPGTVRKEKKDDRAGGTDFSIMLRDLDALFLNLNRAYPGRIR